MTIEEKLTTILRPVFGDELYPVVHPDPDGKMSSVSELYAVYTKIGGGNFNTLEGQADLSRPRVQVSIYSTDYAELKTKEAALFTAMKNANVLANQCIDSGTDATTVANALPNVPVSVSIEGFEEDTKRYFSHSDFYGWIRTT